MYMQILPISCHSRINLYNVSRLSAASRIAARYPPIRDLYRVLCTHSNLLSIAVLGDWYWIQAPFSR